MDVTAKTTIVSVIALIVGIVLTEHVIAGKVGRGHLAQFLCVMVVQLD